MNEKIVNVEEIKDVVVVRVTAKKLYQNVVTPFRETMISLMDSGKRHFIVNLSEVDVINSSGLGVLILTWDRLSREGGKLVIAGLCPLIKEVFQRMKLDLLLPIAGTEEEAFEAIRKGKKIPAP